MKLFLLSSSKLLKPTLRQLKKPLSEMKLAHIITASKAVKDLSYLDRTRKMLKSLGVQFQDHDIDGKTAQQLEEELKQFDVVFVNGGNTFYLLKSIRKSGFTEVIKKLLE